MSVDQFINEIQVWRQGYYPGSLTSIGTDEKLVIYDRRPHAKRSKYELTGFIRAAYSYCDAVHTLPKIHNHLTKCGYKINQANLEKKLDELVVEGLMLREGDWYLSLAISSSDLFNDMDESDIIRRAMAGVFINLADESGSL